MLAAPATRLRLLIPSSSGAAYLPPTSLPLIWNRLTPALHPYLLSPLIKMLAQDWQCPAPATSCADAQQKPRCIFPPTFLPLIYNNMTPALRPDHLLHL